MLVTGLLKVYFIGGSTEVAQQPVLVVPRPVCQNAVKTHTIHYRKPWLACRVVTAAVVDTTEEVAGVTTEVMAGAVVDMIEEVAGGTTEVVAAVVGIGVEEIGLEVVGISKMTGVATMIVTKDGSIAVKVGICVGVKVEIMKGVDVHGKENAMVVMVVGVSGLGREENGVRTGRRTGVANSAGVSIGGIETGRSESEIGSGVKKTGIIRKRRGGRSTRNTREAAREVTTTMTPRTTSKERQATPSRIGTRFLVTQALGLLDECWSAWTGRSSSGWRSRSFVQSAGTLTPPRSR
jgi:hypothetical protein